MAVPKKKLSRSKRNIRRSVWEKSISKHVLFALSIGSVAFRSKQTSFVLPSSFQVE